VFIDVPRWVEIRVGKKGGTFPLRGSFRVEKGIEEHPCSL